MNERELSEAEKIKIENYLRDGKKLRSAVASTLTPHRKSSNARQIAKGNIKALHASWMAKIRSLDLKDRLHDIICKKLDWCRAKKNKTLQWIFTVVQAIILLLDAFKGAIANIIFMILSGFFDLLCDCKK